MKRKALFSALSLKLKNNQIKIVSIKDLEPKTKEFIKIIKNLELYNKKGKLAKVLFVLPGKTENIEKAARNIANVSCEKANLLNTYEVLKNEQILFMEDSIESLQNVFLKD